MTFDAQSKIGLLGLGAYVPERVMPNEEWSEYVETSDEWITERTGIKERRIAAEDETTVDMAVKAAERALVDAELEIDAIDEIIVASDTPEVYLPDTASYVQDRMGAREVTAFDLGGSGCAGFVLALDVARARALMSGVSGKKILVIGVELLTRLMNWKQRETCILFGDAAGAAVVGSGNVKAEILAATAGTDGSKSDVLGLEAGGTRAPFSLERAQRGEHKDIVMKGREVFKEAVTRMSQAAREVLAQAGLCMEDINLVVPHQANMRIIRAVGRAMKVAEERVFVNVERYGNTGSASVPLALSEARDQGRIAPGDRVLLTAFGAGFHWAGLLLQFAK